MIERETHGEIAVLTLNHGRANALDLEVCLELRSHLSEINRSQAKAVVLTGAGNSFSAGVDLLRITDGGEAYVREFLPSLAEAAQTLFFLPKPVVTAINGHAIAGGCLLACAGDRRLMAQGPMQIGLPELRVGVPFPTIAMEIVRFALPAPRAQALIYEGRTLSPDEALSLGMVDEVVDPDDLLDRAFAEAERLAALPAPVFALTKAQIRSPFRDRVERLGKDTDAEVENLWAAPETLERIRDYAERTFRKPKS